MVDGLDLNAITGCLAPFSRSRYSDVPGSGPDTRHPPDTELIQGGKSNLAYRLSGGSHTWILRRPPLGHVLATAHDMTRGYQVMSALAPTPALVPAMVTLCEDATVIGAPFYVAESVDGSILGRTRDAHRPGETQRTALAHQLIEDTLADLHGVDPAEVGLGDFARPYGFLHRQVPHWSQQLEGSHSREIAGFDNLARSWPHGFRPAQRASVVHRDYRLDNVVVGPHQQILAILAWGMATFSDPRRDLGCYLLLRFRRPKWQVRSRTSWERIMGSGRCTRSLGGTRIAPDEMQATCSCFGTPRLATTNLRSSAKATTTVTSPVRPLAPGSTR
jgi:aminoglycoside phosphotransferase (APT) family kinase protein